MITCRKVLVLGLSIVLALTLNAHIKLAPLFSDGMVLQQKEQVNIWGWAEPNKKVVVKASWGVKAQTTADSKGVWRTKIQTPAASFESQQLVISTGKDREIISNVLVGEVWFASGQSNMEMPLRGFHNCPTEGSNQAIAMAGKYSGKIHFVTVPTSPQMLPTDTVSVHWEDCSSATAGSFCAAAYFFGVKLQETLNCPVGLINSSLGATRVEGWTPQELLDTYADVEIGPHIQEAIDKAKDNLYNVDRSLPLVFYNGMIHPFVGYGIKGFLWYQGESNIQYMPFEYATRMTQMVSAWRQRWGMGDLPFYYVEICPFEYWWVKPAILSCALREQQLKAQDMLPNMGMVCTNDLVHDYEYWQIHPSMKREVGERLCLWALAQSYGMKGFAYKNASFRSIEIEGNKAMISFNDLEDGFSRNVKIEGFEICGPDSVFHKAQVGVSGNRVSVQAAEVKEPLAVRYCYKPFQIGNLKDNYGLPIVPFRTDNFELK